MNKTMKCDQCGDIKHRDTMIEYKDFIWLWFCDWKCKRNWLHGHK